MNDLACDFSYLSPYPFPFFELQINFPQKNGSNELTRFEKTYLENPIATHSIIVRLHPINLADNFINYP
jgi:hypothetical protein